MATPGGNAGSVSNPPSPATYFDRLTFRSLSLICKALPQEDRIKLAITYPHIYTFISYKNRICFLADNDANLGRVQATANEFIRLDDVPAQSELLLSSIRGMGNAPLTREFLLNAVRSDLLNGDSLRYAIQHRESRTVAFIAQSMLSRGQPVDEPLPRGPDRENTGHWCHTPLTYALARESYLQAAVLLSLGADIDRIPPNIRHRVRVVRDRIIAGYIPDIAAFVYRDPDHTVFTPSEVNTAKLALNYVFDRLLDDPSHPVPNYVRTRRYPNLPLDHQNNASDGE
ncbi:hypothetical protein CIB48_g8590 [Xylaria polymorpha]|nr:hypothetical protein CIB48_g8590 [Xylaria polymorpha]